MIRRFVCAFLLACALGCSSKPPPGVTAAQQRERYTLRAFDRHGHQVGPTVTFGESLRGGWLTIDDSLSSYSTDVPTDFGLDLLNRQANARVRREQR